MWHLSLEFKLHKRNYEYLGGDGKICLASMFQRSLANFGKCEKILVSFPVVASEEGHG